MLYALLAVAAASLVAADDTSNNDPLAGTWVVVSVTHGGKADPDDKETAFTFASGELTIKEKNGKNHHATYKLNMSGEPAKIDILPAADETPNRNPIRGLFKADKNDLKICLAKAGKDRPTAISSKEGEETALVVLKKVEEKK